MNILVSLIENDDLDNFKSHFKLSNWKDSITTIPNYAGISKYTPEITFNDCDVLKYALHTNADKIFNYLLPLVDTHKHGDNYGWPLLSMALKNNRYDYAYSIINHKTFNPYPMYHTNTFGFIETRENPEEHINFLFQYLTKFNKYDFKDEHLIHVFCHLICYNEDTYQRFNSFYQHILDNPQSCVLDIFVGKMEIFAKEIFYNHFRTFMLDKLSHDQLKAVLESVLTDNIVFAPLFKGDYALSGLKYIIKHPDLLQSYFNRNPVMASYLPLDCLIFLEENNIDIRVENENNLSALDFILKDSNLEDPATLYFMNKYTQQLFDKLEQIDRKSNIRRFCHQKLLSEKLPSKNIKANSSKI